MAIVQNWSQDEQKRTQANLGSLGFHETGGSCQLPEIKLARLGLCFVSKTAYSNVLALFISLLFFCSAWKRWRF